MKSEAFRLNGYKVNVASGRDSVEADRGPEIRHSLRFTRSTYIEEAIIGSASGYADSLLLSVWREVLGDNAEVSFGRLSATVKWGDGPADGEDGVFGLLNLMNASKLGWLGPIEQFATKAKDEIMGNVACPMSVDRLCTQCVYCEKDGVDDNQRLYERFHLSSYHGGEYHFLHVQTYDDKWQMVYTRMAVPRIPPAPATKKIRISCGDVLFDACAFLSRSVIDGLELVNKQWFSALRSFSSGLLLRPLFIVVKNGRVILHSVQRLTCKATPRIVIDKVALGFKCEEDKFDVAVRHSSILSLKWEGTYCSDADALQYPARTDEERRLVEDEQRIQLIIARHRKPA